MSNCKHEYLIYYGRQQTSVMNKFIYLCLCLKCHSTVALPKEFILDFTGSPFKNNS